MDQKTKRSPAFPPTLCHGVARIFLTAPLSYDTVALQRGQCEQLLRYVKLATSSISPRAPHGADTGPGVARARAGCLGWRGRLGDAATVARHVLGGVLGQSRRSVGWRGAWVDPGFGPVRIYCGEALPPVSAGS